MTNSLILRVGTCDSIINVNSRVFIADMLYLRPNDDNQQWRWRQRWP